MSTSDRVILNNERFNKVDDDMSALVKKHGIDIESINTKVSSIETNHVKDINNVNNNITALETKHDTEVSSINLEIASVKKLVSDGKRLLAGAITSKGINTASDASFEVLNTNILQLCTDWYIKGKVDSTKGTAIRSQVLTGYTFTSESAGINKSGTMPNNGGGNKATLNCGANYTIPAGYHDGTGVVTANSLSSQTSATATPSVIESGYTSWVNGNKITGTFDKTAYYNSAYNAGAATAPPILPFYAHMPAYYIKPVDGGSDIGAVHTDAKLCIYLDNGITSTYHHVNAWADSGDTVRLNIRGGEILATGKTINNVDVSAYGGRILELIFPWGDHTRYNPDDGVTYQESGGGDWPPAGTGEGGLNIQFIK